MMPAITAIRTPMIFLLALQSAGCVSQYYRVDPVFKTIALPAEASIFDPKTHQVDTDSTAFKTAYTNAEAGDDGGKKARNALISEIILASDELCLTHKAKIESTANAFNLSFGSLTTLFSGAASVLKAATTAKYLSAGATASNGSRSLVNAEVYQQAFAITILNAIDADRATKRAAIESHYGDNTTVYPVALALEQVNEYHESCSFISGLALISKAVQQRPATQATLQARIATLRLQIQNNASKITGQPKDAKTDALYNSNNAELMKEIESLQTQLSSAAE